MPLFQVGRASVCPLRGWANGVPGPESRHRVCGPVLRRPERMESMLRGCLPASIL
nr:MAG TPA: hypothetical protein [Caudoviricetes sp.]